MRRFPTAISTAVRIDGLKKHSDFRFQRISNCRRERVTSGQSASGRNAAQLCPTGRPLLVGNPRTDIVGVKGRGNGFRWHLDGKVEPLIAVFEDYTESRNAQLEGTIAIR